MSGEQQGVVLQVGDSLSGVLHDIGIPVGCRCMCVLRVCCSCSCKVLKQINTQ